MSGHTVVVELAVLEAAHLGDLVGQLQELLDDADPAADPAVARLVPDAYRDDAEAAREFRRFTEADLLARRRADAAAVQQTLVHDGRAARPDTLPDDAAALAPLRIELSPAQSTAWLRTLSALRLVLATRLGVDSEDDHDADDPRFGVYDWLGYRLDRLVGALEG